MTHEGVRPCFALSGDASKIAVVTVNERLELRDLKSGAVKQGKPPRFSVRGGGLCGGGFRLVAIDFVNAGGVGPGGTAGHVNPLANSTAFIVDEEAA